MSLLSLDAIHDAARQIDDLATHTPLLSFPHLNAQVGGQVFIKPECLQRKGAFKFRGAYNFVSRLSAEQRKAGVVACSSGNHAQGVAEAARLLSMPAVIVMPADAPAVKVSGTKEAGAEVVFYDRHNEDREAIAKKICEERGAIFVHPFNEPLVMAGQGTLGLEASADMQSLGVEPDVALVPVSGGGLAAGFSVAVHSQFPNCAIWACEPAGHDDVRLSLENGEISSVDDQCEAGMLCDALLAPAPGSETFPVLKEHLAGSHVLTDDEVMQAVGYALKSLHLVVEPGGAIGLAALLSGKVALEGRTCLLVLSGGNVDPAIIEKALVR